MNEIYCQNIDIVKWYKWLFLIKFMNWRNCDSVNWKNRVKYIYVFIFRFDQNCKICLFANCLSFLPLHFFKQDIFFIKIRINVSRRFFIRWFYRRNDVWLIESRLKIWLTDLNEIEVDENEKNVENEIISKKFEVKKCSLTRSNDWSSDLSNDQTTKNSKSSKITLISTSSSKFEVRSIIWIIVFMLKSSYTVFNISFWISCIKSMFFALYEIWSSNMTFLILIIFRWLDIQMRKMLRVS